MPPKTIPFSSANVPQTLPFSAGAHFTPAPEKSLAQQIWSGISGVVSSVEQPFVSLAAAPVQGLAKVLGQPDPYAKGIPAGLPGGDTRATVSPLTVGAKAGDLLKAGATVGAVAAAPVTIPGAIGAGAALGAAQGGGQALQDQKSTGEVLKQAAIGGAIGGATGGAVAGIGKLIGAAGDKIMTSVIKPSKADIEDGFSLNTVKQFNLGGSLNTTLHKTQSALTGLTEQLNTKLAGSTQKIDLNTVLSDTIKELTDQSKLKGFGANTKIASGLKQLQEEINIVNADGGLSIPDAQIVKQASGSFGAWQYGKVDPESKAQEIVYNTFYSKLKTSIEQNSPAGVKEINQQLSKLIPVMNAVIRRLPVAERSNIISLNEMIGLAGSAINPVALGPTLLALISRSGAAGSLLSKLGPVASRAAVPASYLTSKLAAPISGTGQ